MWSTLSSIFPYAIAYTIPLLITALGGLYSERSGVTNLGLEGLMLVGYFACAITIRLLQDTMAHSVWLLTLGLVASVVAGALFSVLHAFASINLQADQVISGTAINMLAGALTVYLARLISGSGNVRIRMESSDRTSALSKSRSSARSSSPRPTGPPGWCLPSGRSLALALQDQLRPAPPGVWRTPSPSRPPG